MLVPHILDGAAGPDDGSGESLEHTPPTRYDQGSTGDFVSVRPKTVIPRRGVISCPA